MDNIKNRIKYICNKYITITPTGIIDFKGILKRDIEINTITKEDALYIILKILYEINNRPNNNHIERDLYDILEKVKKINWEYDESLKKTKFFNKNYYVEVKIVIDHLLYISQNRRINNNDIVNKKRITPSQKDKKHIKNKLKEFNNSDLCYILGINSELNFERDKVLRNKIAEELLKSPGDIEKIDDYSPQDIFNILNSKKENNELEPEEIIKIQNKNLYKLMNTYKENYKGQTKKEIDLLISKVKIFNEKGISEMITSKEEYLKIYNKIKKEFDESTQEDIVLFKKYLTHFNDIIFIDNKIKKIKQFNKDLETCEFINYAKREKIIKEYEQLDKELSKINSIPKFLKDKIRHEKEVITDFRKTYDDLKNYKNLSDKKSNRIKKLNETKLDKEIEKNKDFFSDISDYHKKRAIVLDEKNMKVIAGAGTGKTFTIQKKVKYLIEKKGVSPKKILCLSYSYKGSLDLSEKVNEGLDENNKVEACTFHKFCRKIIKDCGYDKVMGGDNLKKTVQNYSKNLIDDNKLSKLIEYFSYYINPPADTKDYKTYNELLSYEKEKDLRTLKQKYYESGQVKRTMQGETVKSIGELIIANYLFMHEIEYEYEKLYDFKLIEFIQNHFLYSGNYFSLINLKSKDDWISEFFNEKKDWTPYRPDFYLPEYDIYLEHFGIGRQNNEKWLGEDYEDQINRKINFHKKQDSKLLTTYYYYLAEGELLEKLEEKLKENNVKIGQMDRKEILEVLKNTKRIEDFKNFNELIMNFINIFEAQNLKKNKLDTFKDKNKSERDGYKRKRQELFLDIVSDIYDKYCKLNEEEIGYNRQISLALEYLQRKKYNKSYDYILVDEYQDINPVRAFLLQELQKITNAKIFIVGDDWQSIYRFNGSDMNLFINFDKYFPNPELIKIEENRRNYNILNNIASEFILKNKKQEQKKLKSVKKNNSGPIKITKYLVTPKRNKVLKLYAIIDKIIKRNPKKEKAKILLLGRNNNDIDDFINNNIIFKSEDGTKITCLIKPELDITFMSIHKAKGLEYDEVIILNLKDGFSGFPNKIEDDSILYFLKEKEEYLYAEERRLLYVALTRTLNNVYLLYPNMDKSPFIKELIEDHNLKSSFIRIDENLDENFYIKEDEPKKEFEYRKTNINCPYCNEGKITIVQNNKRHTKYVRCSEHLEDSYHYNGGPYWVNLEDYKYVEKCPNPNCDGILIKDTKKNKYICTFNKDCNETKKIDD